MSSNHSELSGLDAYKAWSSAVVDAARGRWDNILRHLAPDLGPALDRAGRHVPCPSAGHSDSVDGFRVFKDVEVNGASVCNSCGKNKSGIATLMWITGAPYKEVIESVGAHLGMPWERGGTAVPLIRRTPPPPARPKDTSKERAKDMATIRTLDAMISGARPINYSADTPATRYLVHRGLEDILNDPPKDLLLHPGLEYRMGVEVLDDHGQPVKDERNRIRMKWQAIGEWPAILALVRGPDGNVVACHRIWVTEDGRKPFEAWAGPGPKPDHKKLSALPSFLTVSGAAVRLYDAGHSLGVTEGIETGLAARLLMGMRQRGRKLPVWAGISAGGLEAMDVPERVGEILIFGDNDAAGSGIRGKLMGRGEEAADKLRSRLLNRGGARIFLPAKTDTDWLDVYCDYKSYLQGVNQRYRSVWMTEAQAQALACAADTQLAHAIRDAVDADRESGDAPRVALSTADDEAHDVRTESAVIDGNGGVEVNALSAGMTTPDEDSAPLRSVSTKEGLLALINPEGYKGRSKPHYTLKAQTQGESSGAPCPR